VLLSFKFVHCCKVVVGWWEGRPVCKIPAALIPDVGGGGGRSGTVVERSPGCFFSVLPKRNIPTPDPHTVHGIDIQRIVQESRVVRHWYVIGTDEQPLRKICTTPKWTLSAARCGTVLDPVWMRSIGCIKSCCVAKWYNVGLWPANFPCPTGSTCNWWVTTYVDKPPATRSLVSQLRLLGLSSFRGRYMSSEL